MPQYSFSWAVAMAEHLHAHAHDPNFSLGDALFGRPPPQAPAPDSWRLSLLHDSMDSESRLAVSQLCTASRDWVRQTAKQATLHLRLNGTPAQIAAMLSSARQALTTRGKLPTKVILQQSEADENALVMVPGMLHGLPITNLRLDLLHLHSYNTCTSFLAALATAFPALHSLELHQLEGSLPDPALLPHLRRLTFSCHVILGETVCASVAALAPQLTHLEGTTTEGLETRWDDMLATTSHTLTHFTTGDSLNGRLLTPLVQHAPALTHLTVQNASPEEGNIFNRKQWALTDLILLDPMLEMWTLAQLPRHTGTLNVHVGPREKQQGTLTFSVCSQQGLDRAVVERLPTWVFSGVRQVDLSLDEAMPPEDQPAALAASLQQLRGLQSSNTEVWLTWWNWTPETVQVVEQAMTAGHPFKLCMQCGALTPQLADTLIQHAPNIVDLVVSHVASLKDYQPPVPCNWRQLTVCNSLHLRDLLDLPPTAEPLTVSMQTGIDVHLAVLKQESEVLVDRLTADLPRLFIDNVDAKPFTLSIVPPKFGQQLTWFKQYLKVLNAMQVRPGAALLRLGCWEMTPEMMAELAALPPWCDTVQFESINWGTKPLLCAQLATTIPQHYTTWKVRDMTDVQLVDICVGLAKRGPPADESHKLVLKVMREDGYGGIDKMRAAFVRSHLAFLKADEWVEVAE